MTMKIICTLMAMTAMVAIMSHLCLPKLSVTVPCHNGPCWQWPATYAMWWQMKPMFLVALDGNEPVLFSKLHIINIPEFQGFFCLYLVRRTLIWWQYVWHLSDPLRPSITTAHQCHIGVLTNFHNMWIYAHYT